MNRRSPVQVRKLALIFTCRRLGLLSVESSGVFWVWVWLF